MILDLTATEILALSLALAIAIEHNRAELCADPQVDLDAFLSAAQKLYEAALAFAIDMSPAEAMQ